MDFLDKLYESNYFGIGLFAVISFLVVTFLVVLFFGKKDEQKRKLDETLKLDVQNANENAFKETSVETPVQVPVVETPVMPTPVAPVPVAEPAPVEVPTINPEVNSPVFPTPISNEEPVRPIFEPVKNEIPIINTLREEPVEVKEEYQPAPKVLEPVKYDIPATPVIKEEVTPIVTPVAPEVNTFRPVVEEPVTPTYYEPTKEVKTTIDFDAIAKSISKELDELENATKYHEEPKVTPMSEVVASKPVNQFSSVYVNKPAEPVTPTPMDLPQKIDLPTRKTEDIEPESYSI